MKVNFLIIFCGILWMQSCANAQTVDCDYRMRYFNNFILTNPNKSYYYCYLFTNEKCSLNTMTTINGQHNSGHSDDDVSYLYTDFNSRINTFSSIYCQKFKNLEFIESKADIQSIDANSIESCANLDILDIKGNRVNYIPNELLARNTKLSGIFLWGSQVTTLSVNLFSSQNNLKLLNLKENQIEYLPSNIFNPLINLQYLDLNNNKLQSIYSKWFKNLDNLKELIFGENQFTEIPDKSFEFLTNLEQLHLHKNRIKLLNSNSFIGLHSLQILSLRNNEITELPHNAFEPLRSLKILYLDDNKLSIIDAASFGVHKKLVEINLVNNIVSQIDEKFIDNTAVNVIEMQGNICSKEKYEGIENIKVGLKTCFENFKATKTHPILTSHVEGVRTYQCGQPARGVGNIIGGKNITRGDFPWVAVLSTSSGEYICGGTLVNSRKVVTAAHCILEKYGEEPKLARDIIIQLGAYDLDRRIEVGRISHAVQSVNIHPDWNTHTLAYDADIAVLVLDSDVNFNEFIQPICLVQASSASTGVVVGYGKSEDITKIHEKIPKMIETPIHSNKDCFPKNFDLAKISSGRTFCGGSGKGVGVCRGDSGSGLFVNDGTFYYLRGVVSASLIGGPYGCDVDTYSVFTDVIKHIDWINMVSINRF